MLDDAESWPHWPRDRRDEEYLAWEPYAHMAFRFNLRDYSTKRYLAAT